MVSLFGVDLPSERILLVDTVRIMEKSKKKLNNFSTSWAPYELGYDSLPKATNYFDHCRV